MRLVGVDFTSAPSRRKPITVALGDWRDETTVVLDRVDTHASFESFAVWLRSPGPWLAAFDFPFGLPRELVETLGWPQEWRAMVRYYTSLSRDEIRATFRAFCDARPAGGKFAHRACDASSTASPSMKWVNPPVAFMLHAGIGLLLDAGATVAGLHPGDPDRVALEGYPGLLARELIGRRSYKSDTRAQQSSARRDARVELLRRLEAGESRLHLRIGITTAQRDDLVSEGSADRLDAVLCLLQAAWASKRPQWGLPAGMDGLEGWIVSATPTAEKPA